MNLRGRIKGNDSLSAFTRIDLAALIVIIFLGAAVANPLFISHSRARSETLVCQSNLGQIGRGYQIWGTDHDNWPPFLVPPAEGGLYRDPQGAKCVHSVRLDF